METLATLQAIGVEQEGDLVHFAAEPDHEDAGEVRMACVAPEGALQRLVAVAAVGHAAAGGVHEGGDTVDVRVVGEDAGLVEGRSEEHKSELQSLMRISYAVFCLKKKTTQS